MLPPAFAPAVCLKMFPQTVSERRPAPSLLFWRRWAAQGCDMIDPNNRPGGAATTHH
jgi:hypothetical protein